MNLNTNWRVYFIPADRLKADWYPSCERELINAGYKERFNADIPNANELILMKAGKLPDLFFGDNILKGYDCEYLHAFYVRSFSVSGGECTLTFRGIDTRASIFLDGNITRNTDNMFVEYSFTRDFAPGEHELFIHIFPSVLKSREANAHMGCSAMTPDGDALYIRKAAYMFGWDIFPRLVSGGIYRGVSLEKKRDMNVEQAYFYTVAQSGNSADVNLFYDIDFNNYKYTDYTIRFSAVCGDDELSFERTPFCRASTVRLHTDNAKLWQPAGRGEQNLYACTLQVIRKADGKITVKKEFTAGIRDIRLVRGSLAGEDFYFDVNGEKVFILGTNLVPLDSFPCRGAEKIPAFIDMCRELHINMIRIWGGGFYPDDSLYELCDKYGIMIWQDFMMGCGTYPQEYDDEFRRETQNVVRRLRQHPSIALWSGDNECDGACSWTYGRYMNPNDNVITRKIIPGVLRAEDCARSYLPSSPYVDEKAYETGLPTSEDHLWGPRDYFKGDYYKNAACAFASETGYHGCPDPESLSKFISPDKLNDMKSDEWTLHCSTYTAAEPTMFSYRNDLMRAQVKTLFGQIPGCLSDFSRLSQFSQGEALKFFIERFRYGKWKRTGIIWWNLLDGCPQISDAVVDYYMKKKAAYEYIKRSQAPVCLMCGEPEDGVCTLYAVNDTRDDAPLDYTVTNLCIGDVKLSGHAVAAADSSVEIGKIRVCDAFEFWKISFTGGTNHFVPTAPPYDAETYTKFINQL